MKRRLRQLVRYFGAAGAAAVVDVGGFGAFDALGWPVALAAAASFLIATFVNYGLSARFVFDAPASPRGYLRFLSAAILGFVANVGVTVIAVELFALPPLAGKITGVGVAFFLNFALNALFVFRPRAPKDDA